MASQSVEDALISVFDAKYHYQFWRPVTAIRNGDIDDNNENNDNNATEHHPDWLPLVKTPMYPEYPCAHCIVSSSIGANLQHDLGSEPAPVLSTSSPTASGATRSWNSIEEFVQGVANARIREGVHYRYSTEVWHRDGSSGSTAGSKPISTSSITLAKASHPLANYL